MGESGHAEAAGQAQPRVVRRWENAESWGVGGWRVKAETGSDLRGEERRDLHEAAGLRLKHCSLKLRLKSKVGLSILADVI